MSEFLTDDWLLDYKRCQRRAFLNRYGNWQEKDSERDFLRKLRRESRDHIQSVLAQFYADSQIVPAGLDSWYARAALTEDLMAQGVKAIAHGVLLHQAEISFVGRPDLLVRVSGSSKYGDWHYLPVTIQLGRRPKADYKIIAAFYAQVLDLVQEALPAHAQIILRPYKKVNVDLSVWIPKVQALIQECLPMLHQPQEPEVFISRQRCGLCHWYSHCYKLAQTQKHLSLVPGVTPSRYESLQLLGLKTVESLATSCPKTIGQVFGKEVATQLQQQAQSLIDNRAIRRLQSPHLPTASIEFYFDIEAEPELNLDYLLGVFWVDRDRNLQQFYPFLAEHPEQQAHIWQQFLSLVMTYPQAPIFHYADYEVDTIKRLGKLYSTPKADLEKIVSRCIDLHKEVISSVILPVENYSLKSLANWLGFEWRDVGSGGDQCVYWYDQWLTTGDRTFLTLILRYNEDDCQATFHLKNWLAEFLLTP